jgi:hypothetical protein
MSERLYVVDDGCCRHGKLFSAREIAAGVTLAATPDSLDVRHAALVAAPETQAIDNCIAIVQQSLDTVRAEDDGESRTIRASIGAREHVIRLLTGYRERSRCTPAPLDVERLARALEPHWGPSYLPGLHDVTIHGETVMACAAVIAAAYAEEETP